MSKEIIAEKTNRINTGWNLDHSYAGLPKIFFSLLNPTPVKAPKLVILNHPLAASLGLNGQELEKDDGVAILAGNRLPEGAMPLAQAYAGHQFGHFTRLGDGRAHLLGEQITPQGERFDIQLKGSGRTPYSRQGDGRAGLGPMLREYIISEAMHGLGIPTTRSLAVVTTGETIFRDEIQQGAILTRVAASHLRVGTFQFIASRGKIEELQILADYALKRHFPNLERDENPYLSMFREVIKRQALLIAKWQLVGFIHGVMNTDNVAISGETIDYGPCAFMDTYDPETVFSSIDHQGRYAYGHQPSIAGWNLARFAEAILPLIHENQEKGVQLAEDALSTFSSIYTKNWLAGMRGKLGLFNEDPQDESLIESLFNMMKKYQADYTNTFLALTFDEKPNQELFSKGEFLEWHKLWQARLERQKETKAASKQLMKNSNPALIPRNHRVEEALAAGEKKDFSVMERLLAALKDPYAHSPEQEEYAKLPESSVGPYRTFCGT